MDYGRKLEITVGNNDWKTKIYCEMEDIMLDIMGKCQSIEKKISTIISFGIISFPHNR